MFLNGPELPTVFVILRLVSAPSSISCVIGWHPLRDSRLRASAFFLYFFSSGPGRERGGGGGLCSSVPSISTFPCLCPHQLRQASLAAHSHIALYSLLAWIFSGMRKQTALQVAQGRWLSANLLMVLKQVGLLYTIQNWEGLKYIHADPIPFGKIGASGL